MIREANCSIRECSRYDGVRWLKEDEEGSEVHYCTAFPNGIPDEIAFGKNLHNKPVQGDNGVVYEGPDPEGKRL